MKHCGTQTIETERLILRQFKSEDADAMFKNWANDEEVTKYLWYAGYAGGTEVCYRIPCSCCHISCFVLDYV